MSAADVTLINGGSLVLLQPNTDTAREWLEENIGQGNGYQPYWPTVVVEVRYVDAIIDGMRVDGMRVDGMRVDGMRVDPASEPSVRQPPAEQSASCQCAVPDCPVGHGYNVCGLRPAIFRLWHRLSERAVDFCEGCAKLALQSGKFE